MLLGITQWLTLFSRKYGSFFPSGFQFFWKFFLHSSQDFYKCKNKSWKRRNFQSVSSTFLATLGSSCLRSPYYLLLIPLWFTYLGSFIQAMAVRKPWHGLSCAVPVPQYFTRLLFLFCNLVHKELNSFFLTFIWQDFSQPPVNKLSDTMGLQIFPCSPGLGERIRWIS